MALPLAENTLEEHLYCDPIIFLLPVKCTQIVRNIHSDEQTIRGSSCTNWASFYAGCVEMFKKKWPLKVSKRPSTVPKRFELWRCSSLILWRNSALTILAYATQTRWQSSSTSSSSSRQRQISYGRTDAANYWQSGQEGS